MFGDEDKAVMEVEAGRGLVDGIDHDEPGGSGLAGSDGLAERLGEEQGADALALGVGVDGKSREQDHADGVSRQAADERRRCVGSVYRTHGEAEVAENSFAIDEHEGASNVHLLGGEGVDLKPAVEALIAGLKLAEPMVRSEPFKAAIPHVSGSFG